jgi:hypothetical protein
MLSTAEATLFATLESHICSKSEKVPGNHHQNETAATQYRPIPLLISLRAMRRILTKQGKANN